MRTLAPSRLTHCRLELPGCGLRRWIARSAGRRARVAAATFTPNPMQKNVAFRRQRFGRVVAFGLIEPRSRSISGNSVSACRYSELQNSLHQAPLQNRSRSRISCPQPSPMIPETRKHGTFGRNRRSNPLPLLRYTRSGRLFQTAFSAGTLHPRQLPWPPGSSSERAVIKTTGVVEPRTARCFIRSSPLMPGI